MFVGVDPSPDVLYMRFMKDGKVVRVTKTMIGSGSTIALSPSDKFNFLYGEAFHEIDDVSPRRRLRRSEITDRILLNLLQGQPVEKILRDYETFGGDYLLYRGENFQKRLNSPTFNIKEIEESD